MKRIYRITGVVNRTVRDTVTLQVLADTENEAVDLACRILDVFPDPHFNEDVPYAYIENRENLTSHVEDITEVKKIL